MLNVEVLSENIKKCRERMRMTQTDVARKLFLTPQTISKWESKVVVPDLVNLCALADILHVSIDYLLGNEASQSEKKFIAVDGSGTKTVFVLFKEDGTVLHSISLPCANPNNAGMETTCELLKDGIERLLTICRDVDGILAGIVGADAGSSREKLQQYITNAFPRYRCFIEPHCLNVFSSVRGIDKCVVTLCGIGSAVFGTDGTNVFRAGGLGYRFDGIGSGYDIGCDIIRHCFGLESGYASPSVLTELTQKELGGTVSEKLNVLYANGTNYIASLATLAFTAAEAGDTVAEKILSRNMSRLGQQIHLMRRAHDCGNTVIFSGGLSHRLSVLVPYLIKETGDDIRWITPEFSAIYGACLRCMTLCEISSDPQVFDENYRRTITDSEQDNADRI